MQRNEWTIFDKRIKVFKDYNVQILNKNNNDILAIKNPYWNENIEVYYCYTEGFIFLVPVHKFYKRINNLIEYISSFLSGKLVAAETFKKEKNYFCKDIFMLILIHRQKSSLKY